MILFTNDELENIIGTDEIIPMEKEVAIQEPEAEQQLLPSPQTESAQVISSLLFNALRTELDNIQYFNDALTNLKNVSQADCMEACELFTEIANFSATAAGKIQALLTKVSPNTQNMVAQTAEESTPLVFEGLETKKGTEWKIKYYDYTNEGKVLKEQVLTTKSTKSDIAKYLRKTYPDVEVKSIQIVEQKQSEKVYSYMLPSNSLNESKKTTKKKLNESVEERDWIFAPIKSVNKNITLATRASNLINELLVQHVDPKYNGIDWTDDIMYDTNNTIREFKEYAVKMHLLENEKASAKYNQIMELLDNVEEQQKPIIEG